MIWSVSTSARSSTDTSPSITSTGSIAPLPDVDEPALDRGGGGHPRRDEVGAPALALAPLEVAVRGRGAALALGEDVWVHPQAHGAPGAAPVESGVAEHTREPLLFGLGLHLGRPGDDHRLDRGGDAPPFDDRGGLAQVLDARIGARSDEDALERDLADRGAGTKVHVAQGALL